MSPACRPTELYNPPLIFHKFILHGFVLQRLLGKVSEPEGWSAEDAFAPAGNCCDWGTGAGPARPEGLGAAGAEGRQRGLGLRAVPRPSQEASPSQASCGPCSQRSEESVSGAALGPCGAEPAGWEGHCRWLLRSAIGPPWLLLHWGDFLLCVSLFGSLTPASGGQLSNIAPRLQVPFQAELSGETQTKVLVL